MEQYGGFWVRVVAYLIDAVILLVVSGVTQAILGVVMGIGGSDLSDPFGGANLILNAIGIVIGLTYFTLLESGEWQATVGKKAMGLIVTDTTGNRITPMRAAGRYVCKFVMGISVIGLVGYIIVAFTDRKQGLHDMLASTLVLKGEPGMVGTDTSTFE